MDLSIRHQIRNTKCDIKDFTKMGDEYISVVEAKYFHSFSPEKYS